MSSFCIGVIIYHARINYIQQGHLRAFFLNASVVPGDPRPPAHLTVMIIVHGVVTTTILDISTVSIDVSSTCIVTDVIVMLCLLSLSLL